MVEQRAGASQPGWGSSRFDSVPMALFALRRRSATLLLQPNPLPPTAPAPSCTSAPADHPDPPPSTAHTRSLAPAPTSPSPSPFSPPQARPPCASTRKSFQRSTTSSWSRSSRLPVRRPCRSCRRRRAGRGAEDRRADALLRCALRLARGGPVVVGVLQRWVPTSSSCVPSLPFLSTCSPSSQADAPLPLPIPPTPLRCAARVRQHRGHDPPV